MRRKLTFAVYDDAFVSTVHFSLRKPVAALQKSVFLQQSDAVQYRYTPYDITLWLARKDGQWLLQDADTEEKMLRRPVDQSYEKMSAARLLKDYLGPDFTFQARDIHVLVELPSRRNASCRRRSKYSYADISCQGFLNALWREIDEQYKFDFYATQPFMDDVFRAVESGRWRFRTKRGKQLTATALPDKFSSEEWSFLEKLNRHVVRYGRSCGAFEIWSVVLPRKLYNEDNVKLVQQIAVKAHFVNTCAECEVNESSEREYRTPLARFLAVSDDKVRDGSSFVDTVKVCKATTSNSSAGRSCMAELATDL
ncbi:unnamed protein product [Phytophthora lilii]|uniref:Unnamed protein product n=1 Tax=Phytophthora lilii TaxID=2077276 RepID=A0A9W6WTF1_9STRA|nr:unnamed protein product [Phytophthora lilii]